MAPDTVDLPPPPAIVRPLPDAVPDAPAVTSGVALERGSMARSGDGIIITTIPRINGLIVSTRLDQMVVQAARASLDRSSLDPAWATGAAGDEAGAAAPPVSLGDAVIAAHDQRIAVLRERIGALCGQAVPTRLADDLRDRLIRAEAARRLALARAGVRPSDGEEPGYVGCRSKGAVMASTEGVSRRAIPAVRPWALLAVVSGKGQAPSTAKLAPATSRTASVHPPHRASYASARVHVGYHHAKSQRIGFGHTSKWRLSKARRSLAAARRALAGGHPLRRPVAPARIAIAGLWQWEGSETWRLPPNHAKAS